MADNSFDDELEVLAETESYVVLRGNDLNDEQVYSVQMGMITLHLFREEWDEFVKLIQEAEKNKD